jgi:hypothetical protein
VELNFDVVYDYIMAKDDIVVVENVDVIDDKFACDANAQTQLSTFQMLDISPCNVTMTRYKMMIYIL